MPMIDAYTRFSNAQAVTAEAVSTNTLDLSAIRNLGVGVVNYIVVQVTTAFTDAASNSTLLVTLEVDGTDAFGSATVSKTIGTFAALSAIGANFVVPLGPGELNEEVARLRYTPANGDLSTGSITAFITASPQLYTAYPNNYTITAD